MNYLTNKIVFINNDNTRAKNYIKNIASEIQHYFFSVRYFGTGRKAFPKPDSILYIYDGQTLPVTYEIIDCFSSMLEKDEKIIFLNSEKKNNRKMYCETVFCFDDEQLKEYLYKNRNIQIRNLMITKEDIDRKEKYEFYVNKGLMLLKFPDNHKGTIYLKYILEEILFNPFKLLKYADYAYKTLALENNCDIETIQRTTRRAYIKAMALNGIKYEKEEVPAYKDMICLLLDYIEDLMVYEHEFYILDTKTLPPGLLFFKK